MGSCSSLQSQQLGPNKVRVTILASEWGSSKGGLSTINRELAIQLAKFPEVQITYFLPKCSEEDGRVALSHGIKILKATPRTGFEEMDWLSFSPTHLKIDVIIGHGVKLGRQAQVIRDRHKCVWLQVVHTDPEELGMFKSYENPISKGEKKHNDEVELCKKADLVAGVGPKLAEAYRKCLRICQKVKIIDFTPGIFQEFVSVQQVHEERKQCSVLVFGRGDAEDFALKGFDIAAKSAAALPDTHLVFVGAADGKHEEIANRLLECGIPKNRLRVRGYIESRESLKQLFCEVDLVLMPSRTEGFGLTGLEALSAGLPVIVSKNSGFGEALGNIPFGSSFVIDSEDPSAWTAAIKDIWNKNRQTRLNEAKILRDCYEKRYSWSEQCKNLLKMMINSVNDASKARGGFKRKSRDYRKDVSTNNKQSQLPFTSDICPSASLASHRTKDASRCEPQIPSEAQGEFKKRSREYRKGISITDYGLSERKERGDEKESKQHSGISITDYGLSERKERGEEKESKQHAGISITDCGLSERKESGEEKESKQHAASPSCQRHIIEQIRQIYQKREGIVFPVPWCEGFSFQLESIFTRLRIVAKEKRRGRLTKAITNITSIFTSHEDCQHPRIVLIEGEPGMGKTTYCQKLAYDWSTKQDTEWDESFPRVEVLLLLRCREIESSIWKAIDDQILPEEIGPELKETFFRFVRENPSKVLLVLDGLDEADPQKMVVSFSLIHRRLLPGCHIVLTSRHEAGSKVRPYSDTLLEIKGFERRDAECYIREYFRNEGQMSEKLIQALWHDDDDQYIEAGLKELTKNPLNTLLLCVLFEDFGGVLPNNKTKLYLEIVLFVLRRYENKNHLPSSGKDPLVVYKEELMTLGKRALESLRKGELHFEDVEGNFTESLFIKFGFLSIQGGSSKRTPCSRFSFFHKSFQEFFSGLYLAFSILDGEIDKTSVLTDETFFGQLNQVFMFMSGIIASQSEETAVSLVNCIASLANLEHSRSSGQKNSTLVLALVFINECQPFSEDLSSKLANNFGSNLDFTKIDLAASLYPLPGKTLLIPVNSSVTELFLSRNSIGDKGATSLSKALTGNTSLTTLDLCWNSIGDEGATALSKALTGNTSLTTLDWSQNLIGYRGATSLSKALTGNPSLAILTLSGNSIGGKGATSLSKALKGNSSLTVLELSDNSIGAEGATSLSQALPGNSSLTTLHLRGNSIGDEGATSLSKALTGNSSLTTLDLSDNSICAEGATSLSQALTGNTSLTTLHLCWNSIGDEGTTALSKALTGNSSLTTLKLSHNSIGAEGAASLSQVLTGNTSLTTLDLCWNSIGDEGATALSRALTGNTSLTTLKLSDNSIGAEGATSLSRALTGNTSLTTLDLYWNSIGDEGATALSRALTGNISLTTLKLSKNSIGAEGATSLSQALTGNTSLTTLDLSDNSIGDEGASSLSKAFTGNTSLTSLNLCDNSIGDGAATSLSQALTGNTFLTS